MERKQDSPRGPGGRRTGRSALLMAGVLAAGVLATAGPTSAAKADGCYGSCGCDNGCGYTSYCGGGCGYTGYTGYSGYSGYSGYTGQTGYSGVLPRRAGVQPFANQDVWSSVTTGEASPNPALETESVTLSAHVACTFADGTLAGDFPNSGEVIFYDASGNEITRAQVGEGGAAEMTVDAGTLPVGRNEITASFTGGTTPAGAYCEPSESLPFEALVLAAPTPTPTPTPPSVKVKVKVVVAPRVRIAIFKGHFHHMAPAAPARPAVPVTG